MVLFSSSPRPKFTSSSSRLDTGVKLIITSSDTKDVYVRPCISLIGHHMQIYTCLFTSFLVVRNAVFLIITGGGKDFRFPNEKFPDFVHPYNLLEYFQNKEIDSNKTETPVYKWIYQRTTVS